MSPEGDAGAAARLQPQQTVVQQQLRGLLHDDEVDGPEPRIQLLPEQGAPAKWDLMALEARGPGDVESILTGILVGERGTVEQQELDVVPGEVGPQSVVEPLPVPAQCALDDGDGSGLTSGRQSDPPVTEPGTQ